MPSHSRPRPLRLVVGEAPSIAEFSLAAWLARRTRFRVCGHSSTTRELVMLSRQHAPDVALLDLNSLQGNGPAAIRALKASGRCGCALVMCSDVSRSTIQALIRAGADGYVVRVDDRPALADIIEQAALGRGYYADEIAEAFRDPALHGGSLEVRAPERWNVELPAPIAAGKGGIQDKLTPREREIIRLVALGHTSASVARALFISVPTVRKHRENVMRKLDVHSTAGVTAYAIAHGLLPPD